MATNRCESTQYNSIRCFKDAGHVIDPDTGIWHEAILNAHKTADGVVVGEVLKWGRPGDGRGVWTEPITPKEDA